MRELIGSDLLDFAKFFTPISHTKGRIRVRVKPEIKNLRSNFNSDQLGNLINQINGIKSFKLNPLIGSLTIFYDNEIFPQRLWDDFLNGQNSAELATFLNQKKDEIF